MANRTWLAAASGALLWTAPVSVAAAPAVATAAATVPTTAPAEAATVAVVAESSPPPSPWTASCEAGFTLLEGNTSSRSLGSRCDVDWGRGAWRVALAGRVQYGVSRYGGLGTDATGQPIARGDFRETANNWRLELREERSFGASERTYVFAVEGVGSDRYGGYWLRKDVQVGAGYRYVKTGTQQHALEAGLQLEHDDLVAANADGETSELRLGAVVAAVGEVAFNDLASADYRLAYLPSLLEQVDYRLSGEGALSLQLNSWLAYRLGLSVYYDHRPPLIDPVDASGAAVTGAAPVPARTTDTQLTNTLVVTIR